MNDCAKETFSLIESALKCVNIFSSSLFSLLHSLTILVCFSIGPFAETENKTTENTAVVPQRK